MSATADQLYATALALPETERAELAARLWDSLSERFDGNIEQEWQAEIERRIGMIDRGEVELIPDEEVQRRLDAKYGPLKD